MNDLPAGRGFAKDRLNELYTSGLGVLVGIATIGGGEHAGTEHTLLD
jgi:hypothetical protein